MRCIRFAGQLLTAGFVLWLCRNYPDPAGGNGCFQRYHASLVDMFDTIRECRTELRKRQPSPPPERACTYSEVYLCYPDGLGKPERCSE